MLCAPVAELIDVGLRKFPSDGDLHIRTPSTTSEHIARASDVDLQKECLPTFQTGSKRFVGVVKSWKVRTTSSKPFSATREGGYSAIACIVGVFREVFAGTCGMGTLVEGAR